MSLTCHEEIGRVGRVGRGCYEDACDLSATSRACRARGFGERHDTRTNGKFHEPITDLVTEALLLQASFVEQFTVKPAKDF